MVIKKLGEIESGWNEKLLPRLKDINKQITEEVGKESFDIESLKILSKQRSLLMSSLKGAEITIDSEESKHIDELIEQGLNGTLPRKKIIKVLDDPKCESNNGITHTISTEGHVKRKKPSKSTLDIGYMPPNGMPEYDEMGDEYNELLENLREEGDSISRKRAQEGQIQARHDEMEWRKSLYEDRRPEKPKNKGKDLSVDEERRKKIDREIIEHIQSRIDCDEVIPLGLWHKVRKGKKWGIYDDIKNKFKLNIEYNEIVRIGIGYMVKKGEKRGLFDEEFNKILNVEYDSIEHIIGGYIIKKGNNYGLINNSGKKILKSEYEEIIDARSGYIVKKDGKRGAFNSSGKEVIKVEYDEIEDKGGIYKVKKGTKYGIIDKEGEKLIDIKYDDIESVGDGYKVKEKGKRGIINSNGNTTIIEAKYDEIETIGNRFKVKQNGKRGLIKSNGEILLETDYDGIEELGYKGFYIIKKDNKYGLINNKGNIKIGIHCDKIEMISPYILKRRSGGEDYYKEFVNE